MLHSTHLWPRCFTAAIVCHFYKKSIFIQKWQQAMFELFIYKFNYSRHLLASSRVLFVQVTTLGLPTMGGTPVPATVAPAWPTAWGWTPVVRCTARAPASPYPQDEATAQAARTECIRPWLPALPACPRQLGQEWVLLLWVVLTARPMRQQRLACLDRPPHTTGNSTARKSGIFRDERTHFSVTAAPPSSDTVVLKVTERSGGNIKERHAKLGAIPAWWVNSLCSFGKGALKSASFQMCSQEFVLRGSAFLWAICGTIPIFTLFIKCLTFW